MATTEEAGEYGRDLYQVFFRIIVLIPQLSSRVQTAYDPAITCKCLTIYHLKSDFTLRFYLMQIKRE